jgi:small subunit ribosomal protein S2
MTTTSSALKKELEDMLKNAVHFGHVTSKWNPKMKKYLFGQRQGVHIFDLRATHKALHEALLFIKKMVADGRTILFVNTKQQAIGLVEDVAKKANMPFVSQKWIGGLLTNFKTVKTRIKHLLDLKGERQVGGFDKYTKKEALKLTKTIDKLELAFGGLTTMNRVPDAVFVVDVSREQTAVREANRLKIPVIGICDSNADPSSVQYPIPANDDAIKSLEYVMHHVGDAIAEARQPAKK